MRLPEIRTFPVADIEIPAELSRLYDIAYNLWWTWSPRTHLLFSAIDPARWIRYHNPVELLINVEPHRWEPLLLDESFMTSYQAVVDEFDRYLAQGDAAWFPRTHRDYKGGPIAYFSTEFGWHESIGIYSGGLGVLSGDHCKSASDLGLPFVGVGLMYRRGYFRQTVDADGNQQHSYPDYDLRRLPLLPVTGPGGREVRVTVEMPDREVSLRIWKATVGRVPVLLLDTDVRENDPADRPITSFLYVNGREMRLCQEIMLGIGGVKALRALGISPSVWHLNEGHSAFVSFERIRERMKEAGVPFADAVATVGRSALFTTHTPVPAGNESFDVDLVRRYFAAWAQTHEIGIGDLLSLGRAPTEREAGTFNLTALAIRSTGKTNGVSRLHGQVADRMWEHLQGAGESEGPRIGHITNGVHIPTWMGPEMSEVLRRHMGMDFEEHLLDPGFGDAVHAIPNGEIWAAHQSQKRRLIRQIRERVLPQLARHGRSPDELRQVHALLDPEALTLGFARRFATYKRADLIFRDPARLQALLTSRDRPAQIVFAGKAHPADRPGQEIIRTIFEASHSPSYRGHIVLLENYDMRIARFMVQGVDVWLNTPRRPLEASGTSGMKVSANGGLNCSVLDGWWCEGYDASHGWVIGGTEENDDSLSQDRKDAESLYSILTDQIVPHFYDRDESGLPVQWIVRMKHVLARLLPRFSTARMVREYTQKAYFPSSRGDAVDTEIDEARLWSL